MARNRKQHSRHVVRASRWNWMVFVAVAMVLISLVLQIVALATRKWAQANVTTTPDYYLGHSDIDQDIGLFQMETTTCCLGQWRYATGLFYCGTPNCHNAGGETGSEMCDFGDRMRYLNRVDFNCQRFRDGLYTTIVFSFFCLTASVAAVVIALLKYTLLSFPLVVGVAGVFCVIPIIVWPLVSYDEVKSMYNDRFPDVQTQIEGYIFDLDVRIGVSYLLMVFAFCCLIVALIFAAVGAWKARRDEIAARRAAEAALSHYTEVHTPPKVVPPPLEPVVPTPAPVPVMYRPPPREPDVDSVVVHDDGYEPVQNPIAEAFTTPSPARLSVARSVTPLTKQNVEYNDFVHRTDGTFA